jgi:hypothetical protein
VRILWMRSVDKLSVHAALLALLAVPFACSGSSSNELRATPAAAARGSISVASPAVAYPELTNAFKTETKGWIGADGAYSMRINESTTLWTFGDTWIGDLKGNERSRDCLMLNNTVAIQKLGRTQIEPLQFKWIKNGTKSASLWTPKETGCYYWPGDGITLDGKLFVFLHKITTDKSKPEPFQFRTVSDSVVRIDNPLDSPKDWKLTYADLGNDGEKLEYGTATICDDKFVYIYCSARQHQHGLNVHPAAVCRVSREQFKKLDFKHIEYLSSFATAEENSDQNAQNSTWTKNSKDLSILFADAAPEMSIAEVKGIPGLIAVYMPPFSKEIFIRHAMTPHGPWSERIKIYDCPEKDNSIILYSAKAHQELARSPGQLIVTYCRNSKDNETHYKNASIYFPQAIRVKLKSQPPHGAKK